MSACRGSCLPSRVVNEWSRVVRERKRAAAMLVKRYVAAHTRTALGLWKRRSEDGLRKYLKSAEGPYASGMQL